jgi:hypothetical protein
MIVGEKNADRAHDVQAVVIDRSAMGTRTMTVVPAPCVDSI